MKNIKSFQILFFIALFLPVLQAQVLVANFTEKKNRMVGSEFLNSGKSVAPYRYEPVPGKFIGILTHPQDTTVNKFFEYRTSWGFTGIFVYTLFLQGIYHSKLYDNAISAGFLPSNILVMVSDDLNYDYRWAVPNMPAGFYYIDEAVEHDCYGRPTSPSVSRLYTPLVLSDIKNYVKSYQPDAKFGISGYKRCSHLITAGNYADIVMYASYQNWNEFTLTGRICHVNISWADSYEFPWFTGNNLQIDSWNDMRSKFGSKFSMAWMNLGDEFNELFPRANSLGLNGVWLYTLEGINPVQLQAFCDAAAKNGWLTKIDDGFVVNPSNLTAVAPVLGKVRLNWNDNSNNEAGFIIERKGSPSSSFIEISMISSNLTSYADTTVGEGITYDYRVRAYNPYTQSMYSNEVKVTTLTRLVVPTLIFPENGTNSQPITLTLKWDMIPEALSYQFQLTTEDHFQSFIIDSILISNQIQVSSLSNMTDYYWRVNATYNTGTSIFSAIWRFTTIIAPTVIPQLLLPENGSSNIFPPIFLKWSASDYAENHRVQLAIDSSFIFLIIDDSTVVDTFIHVSNLFEGQSYFWRVRSQNAAGASNFSSIWNFKTWLPSPQEATTSSVGVNKVLLSWKDMSEMESGFIIERKLGDTTSSDNYYVLDTVGVNITSFIDTTMDQSTKYSYRLFAYNESTISGYSNQTQVTTLTNVGPETNLPKELYLYQNYPNPFNDKTRIRFSIPKSGEVSINIYDILGNLILVPFGQYLGTGTYDYSFDGSQLSSGNYLLSIRQNNLEKRIKITLLK